MLAWTFIRQSFYKWTAYRTAFWVDVFSRILQMYVLYAVWSLLYRQNPSAFGDLSFSGLFGYVVLGVILGAVLTLDEGPHVRIAERVRTGMIAVELIKPISFIRLCGLEFLGDALIRASLYAGVPYLFAVGVFGIPGPPGPGGTAAFLFSLGMSVVIQFYLHVLFGLISFVTLDLVGFQFAYWALVRFFSGQWIPLYLYPDSLRSLLYGLPFQAMFATPQSIYVGRLHGPELVSALAVQAMWAVLLGLAAHAAWRTVQRRIVIQGG
ncbi:MAG: ABC-2 family transporter protein [Alicyclobacillaceae bacterium]|nr:ABC-2 family transporter protein [Alicyclobacillaceae bacterium]